MYLIYIDESGRTGRAVDNHFVLSGIAVHEQDCWPLGRQLQARVSALAPSEPAIEVHATDLIRGSRRWARYSPATRLAVLDGTFDILRTWIGQSGHAPVLFACVIHKRSFPGRSIVQLAYDQLLARTDTFLSREFNAGRPHRSIVISDRSSYEALLQRLAPEWKFGHGATKRLNGLAEVPLFVDSQASRMIQLADCVAWATWNYYERGFTEYFKRIVSRFDTDLGIQHGLFHMVRGHRACGCTACSSRRGIAVSDVLPNWTKIHRPPPDVRP